MMMTMTSSNMPLAPKKCFFLVLALLLSIVLNPTFCSATTSTQATNNDFETDDLWSQCNCPSSTTTKNNQNHAKMAYLISVHNRRTIHDGAHLLKSLIETSAPGNTAVILIHVDHRVGIANPATVAKNETLKNQFLYHESPLKRYVDACLQNSCVRSGNHHENNHPHKTSDDNNSVLLEVHSHFAPLWGEWSMNEPTLWAMEYLLYHPQLHRNTNKLRLGSSTTSSENPPSWDTFINLSGDTLPIISAQRISQLFNPINGPLGNTNFVTSNSCATGLIPTSIFEFPKGTMKRSHYFQHGIPKKLSYVDTLSGEWKSNVETPIYFGSQWMALTHEFVEYVIRSMSHPNGLGSVLKETLVDTEVQMTDESFFATLLMNSPFKDTIPKLNSEDKSLVNYPSMQSLRYERMDENTPNAWDKWTSSNSLYDIPPKFKSVTDGEGPAKPWGPYFLGIYDLGDIKDSGALFIRKVSWSVDENLVRMLPVVLSEREEEGMLLEWDVLPDIRWPKNGVNVKKPWVWRSQEE
ncbi:core-2/I-branching enzyme [Skeletonema marinoi]|uniref:protein xylosyltransferase n=1 Tax=Skeletonema marinoi TaxID=267567 RepID=A0AAD9D9A5_9STRA|nr:core-2/I-branching enzyme [Skeletonema marinoi]